jgi:hypothetical protein
VSDLGLKIEDGLPEIVVDPRQTDLGRPSDDVFHPLVEVTNCLGFTWP